MKNLVVKEQYLAWGDGTPFFFLADTAWELAHRLDRQEVEHYFRIRKRQGFDAAQIVPPCGRMTYVPPVSGTDWVLILDADQGE